MNFESILLSISLLIIISIFIAKFAKNIGVPVLLLFLGVGMLAGSEGPGGIYFDDAYQAQSIGIVALVFILFSGGLDTKWKDVKPITKSALSLATLGVLLTTVAVGFFVFYVFGLPLKTSFLIGAIVSSTDAAAVFSILSFSNLKLKGTVKPLLELESGSNDPMAVFLTISMIELITNAEVSYLKIAYTFFLEMGVGLLIGFIAGKLLISSINKLHLPVEGLYMVFACAFAMLTYTLTYTLGGSGFLSVYIAGVVISNDEIIHKKSLYRFFDGLAWLSQIVMFLSLGLLVFPGQLIPVIGEGILISLFLILIARPVSVFISLSASNYSIKEKLFISWVGLRGAVPIILATFPLIEGIKEANQIFNVIFFIVITSTILQGWTTPFIARLLKIDESKNTRYKIPLELTNTDNLNFELINLKLPDNPELVKKSLVEIPALKGSLVVMINREGSYFVPVGSTVLQKGDLMQILVPNDKVEQVKSGLS